MFKKGRKLMAFLLTLVVVASLVYDGGYASWLAQAASPDAQAETVSEEDSGTSDSSDGNEVEDPSQGNGGQEENGSGEEQESSGKEDQNTEDPDGDQDPAENDGSGENDGTTGEVPPENGDSGENGTQSDTPTGTPEPTEPAEPTTAPEATTAPEENEAQELEQQTLYPDVDAGSKITLEGMMPKGASATASAVSVDIAGQEVLAAYDITIYDVNGAVYQPADGAIQVEITNAAVEQAKAEQKELNVYHMEDANDTPEKVNAEPVSDAGVMFQAEKFSIYAVTTPPHYTQTYIFKDEDGTVISKQILSDNETLVRPKTPENEDVHKKFKCWVKEDGTEISDDDFTKTAAQLNGGALGSETTGDEHAIILKPKYVMIYFVYYMDQPQTDPSGKVSVTQNYVENQKLNTSGVEIETKSDEDLVGWLMEDGTEVTAETPVTRDMTLYPKLEKVSWIQYNTHGGSAMEPTAVRAGTVTQKPSGESMTTQKGYKFAGWYADEDYNTPFTFGEELKGDVTIHAKWDPDMTNYTVVIWQQKVDDDKNASETESEKYDYKESISRQAKTGEIVSATEEDKNLNTQEDKKQDYEGFRFVRSTEATVKADGSTVVNVFYDRLLMTFEFYESCNTENGTYSGLIQTMTGLYGSSLQENEYEWPSENGWAYYVWEEVKEGNKKVWKWNSRSLTFHPRFIYTASLKETTIKLAKFNSGSASVRHYQENLGGTGWTEAGSGNAGNGTFLLNDKFDGFTPGWYGTSTESGSTEDKIKSWTERGKDAVTGEYNQEGFEPPTDVKIIAIRHVRKKYDLDYWNGGDGVLKDYHENLKFETPLNGYNKSAPNRPEGMPSYYHFTKWYANPECTVEFNFDQTMPSHGLVLYAGWEVDKVKVTYDYNDGTGKTEETPLFDAGNVTEEPENPKRDGYQFAGWVTEDGEPFNFDTVIEKNITLTAKWIGTEGHQITYLPGKGTGAAQTDPVIYVVGAKAKVKSIKNDWGWEGPDENQGFLCWVDENNNEYYPRDEFTMPNNDVTLTAKWAKGRKTKLIYDPGEGTGDRKEIVILTPNEQIIIEEDAESLDYKKDGYYFAGWSTTPNETNDDKLLQKDAFIQVDTEDQDNNILYAQWRKYIQVKLEKQVYGNMGVAGPFEFEYTITRKKNGSVETGRISITAGESKVIPDLMLEAGDTITVEEISAEDYETKIIWTGKENGWLDGKNTGEIELKQDITITFSNEREVVPPMGITDNMLPFAAMILAGLGAGVVFFLPRRRRQ